MPPPPCVCVCVRALTEIKLSKQHTVIWEFSSACVAAKPLCAKVDENKLFTLGRQRKSGPRALWLLNCGGLNLIGHFCSRSSRGSFERSQSLCQNEPGKHNNHDDEAKKVAGREMNIESCWLFNIHAPKSIFNAFQCSSMLNFWWVSQNEQNSARRSVNSQNQYSKVFFFFNKQ